MIFLHAFKLTTAQLSRVMSHSGCKGQVSSGRSQSQFSAQCRTAQCKSAEADGSADTRLYIQLPNSIHSMLFKLC